MPVVVVGHATTALSVQRLAAKLGHPVFAACAPKSWASRTRHYRPLPDTSLGCWRGELDDNGVQHLRELPFDRAILIPAADDAGLWLSKLPEDLLGRYLVCGSDTVALDKLQDKGLFSALTTELGVATPRSYDVEDRDQLLNLPIDWSADHFIKPRVSQIFNRKIGVKALRFPSQEAALSIWDQHDLGSMGILIQEYVAGGAFQHYFIDGFRDRKGNYSVCLARRRLRMYPQDFGDSSLCKSVEMSEVEPAWQGLKSILDTVGYRGIFSAEFKQDANDQQFKLIEINTRPWVYIQFAEFCGVNMVDLYIKDALGQDVPDNHQVQLDRYCVNLLTDYRAVRSLPKAVRPGWFGVMSAWIQSFKVVFDWRDPRPAMLGALEIFRSKTSRLFSTARRDA